MRSKEMTVTLLAATILLGCLAGCSKPADSVSADQQTKSEHPVAPEAPVKDTVTVTDDSGQTLTIAQPIEKVVLLDTGPFEVMDAFGKLDLVAGNHQSIAENELYAEIRDLPVVATHSEINYEMIAELQPQVVLSSVRAHGVVTDDENLSGFEIKDIKLNLRNPDTMRDDITMLGEVFDCRDKATEIVRFYDKWENFVLERVDKLTDEERVKVFVEYHAGSFKTGAPDSRFYSQVVLAGGINVAKELAVGDEPEVSAEWVAEMNPDVIIREASGLGYNTTSTCAAKEIYDELVSRDGLSMTKAVQNGNVHLVGVNIYSRPGYIVGTCYLAKWFYPELFEDFDPAVVLEEYFELFHPGKELKGIWVYDE